MEWYEFFKPTLVKILLVIIFVAPIFFIASIVSNFFGVCTLFIPLCIYRVCSDFPSGEYICIPGLDIDGIIANVVLYLVLYLLSTFLVFLINKIRKLL
jgi:hypothetical protein